MSKHLQVEIERLHNQLLSLCASVEKNVSMAVRAIEQRDADLARHVIGSDDDIDRMEVELEEEGLKILALHQPVAIDLRVIVAALKINNDLERIGDLAVNIAERAVSLAERDPPPGRFDFSEMVKKSTAMLTQGLDSLVRLDIDLARRVCDSDAEIDRINKDFCRRVEAAIEGSTEHAYALICLHSVSRHLERIADHACNVAEDVIYMLSGDIVRHHEGPMAGGQVRGQKTLGEHDS